MSKRIKENLEKANYAGLEAPPTWGSLSLSGRVISFVRKNVLVPARSLTWRKAHISLSGLGRVTKNSNCVILNGAKRSEESWYYAGWESRLFPIWVRMTILSRPVVTRQAQMVAVYRKPRKCFLTILFICLFGFLCLPSFAQEDFNEFDRVWISDDIKIEGVITLGYSRAEEKLPRKLGLERITYFEEWGNPIKRN